MLRTHLVSSGLTCPEGLGHGVDLRLVSLLVTHCHAAANGKESGVLSCTHYARGVGCVSDKTDAGHICSNVAAKVAVIWVILADARVGMDAKSATIPEAFKGPPGTTLHLQNLSIHRPACLPISLSPYVPAHPSIRLSIFPCVSSS